MLLPRSKASDRNFIANVSDTKNKSQSSKTRAALALKSAGLIVFLCLEIDKIWLAAQIGILAAQTITHHLKKAPCGFGSNFPMNSHKRKAGTVICSLFYS